MARWPKPPEGSWTEHYPELGTGLVSFEDSVSPEFYELEKEAIFERAWLNLCRVEQIPDGGRLVREIEITGTSIALARDPGGAVRAADLATGAPVHCDVWSGFVFVNLAPEPEQTLTGFLGPMITALGGYPFERMTERYVFRADNRSNWKLFADAFQEYYHVPSLHSQQVPGAVRTGAGFECAHYQLDGPHRMVSTGGARRWTLPPEYMYPIERATRSGLVGPWESPDIGAPPPGLNPGRIDPWGIDNFQIFPNVEILFYRGWYLLYRYWPTSPRSHRFEAELCYQPARTVRERIEHEVSSVVFKEFALQDAGMLTGTQTALEAACAHGIGPFPVNDQEILVRHFHKVVADWVDAHRAASATR